MIDGIEGYKASTWLTFPNALILNGSGVPSTGGISATQNGQTNDAGMLAWNREADYFLQMIKDQFDTLYREGAENGRVMCLSLHPHNIGRPNAAKHLDEALRIIATAKTRDSNGDLILATGSAPRALPGLDVDGERIITSDEALTWNQIFQMTAEAAGVATPRWVHIASDFITACYPDTTGTLLGDKSNSALFDNTKIKRFVPDFVATTRVRSRPAGSW